MSNRDFIGDTMINEEELSYKRGDLVEFKLTLGGGPRRCRGIVLNTAVLYGRAARQIWVLDMDDATLELNDRWRNKKIIVPEGDVVSLIPAIPIGRDTLLRENPVCCPVRDLKRGEWETPAITVTVAVPVSVAAPPKFTGDAEKKDEPNTTSP
jgi:hypothetical protein